LKGNSSASAKQNGTLFGQVLCSKKINVFKKDVTVIGIIDRKASSSSPKPRFKAEIHRCWIKGVKSEPKPNAPISTSLLLRVSILRSRTFYNHLRMLTFKDADAFFRIGNTIPPQGTINA
jgi:hypothetical protein